MGRTFKCHIDDDDRGFRTRDAIRALAEHLGGEGVGDDDWHVPWVDGKGTVPEPKFVLAGLREVAAGVDEMTRQVVWEARKLGRSWDEIGTALGITRQAAHKRFG